MMKLRRLDKSGIFFFIISFPIKFYSLLVISCPLYIGLSIDINNKTVFFDVSLICGSFDAPAKAAVQNIMLHNGFFSCHYCEHPGETINKHVKYPIKENVNTRSHEEVIRNMREAAVSNRIINGLKGFSVLDLAPNFNLVFGFAIDSICIRIFWVWAGN